MSSPTTSAGGASCSSRATLTASSSSSSSYSCDWSFASVRAALCGVVRCCSIACARPSCHASTRASSSGSGSDSCRYYHRYHSCSANACETHPARGANGGFDPPARRHAHPHHPGHPCLRPFPCPSPRHHGPAYPPAPYYAHDRDPGSDHAPCCCARYCGARCGGCGRRRSCVCGCARHRARGCDFYTDEMRRTHNENHPDAARHQERGLARHSARRSSTASANPTMHAWPRPRQSREHIGADRTYTTTRRTQLVREHTTAGNFARKEPHLSRSPRRDDSPWRAPLASGEAR